MMASPFCNNTGLLLFDEADCESSARSHENRKGIRGGDSRSGEGLGLRVVPVMRIRCICIDGCLIGLAILQE